MIHAIILLFGSTPWHPAPEWTLAALALLGLAAAVGAVRVWRRG